MKTALIHFILNAAILSLLSSCATIQPASLSQPTKVLSPTSDFTMRLPPFVRIEVLKNSRIPVLGVTHRNGKDYRVVALPAPAAAALTFLINDDGSFEGSAINTAGSRMGFSYNPVPSDVRLVSESSIPLTSSDIIGPDQAEAIRAALDAHLATTLKDPVSAIQYAAGEPTECRNVANVPPQARDSWCVCYSVNAKNSMGGYTGAKLGVVLLLSTKKPYRMIDIPEGSIVDNAACKNVNPRDAGLIHALVR